MDGPSPGRKFVMAASPRMRLAAASYARAASSAVSNVPSHNREPCRCLSQSHTQLQSGFYNNPWASLEP